MRFVIIFCMSLILTGCSMMGGFKLPSLNSNKTGDSAGTVAAATATSAAVDRMAEINRRNEETRAAMELEYAKFREQLTAAYNNREKLDNDNFDRISEINYGIFKATEELVTVDTRVLIANLKSKENMARLMPITEAMKKTIIAEIEADRKKLEADITKKYEARVKEGEAAAAAFEAADKLVKEKEAEKAKLRDQQSELLAKLKASQDAERAKLQKEAADAVAVAKEKQRLEMVGWIVKALLGVGIVILVIGFLMKSPTFIVSGIAMLGLAYVAATIPFWVVASIMGVFVIVMVMMDPKTGKISMLGKKKEEPVTAPPSA
jgi:uncharacterized membrane protein